ncbi:ribbon-helix-helix protein, CopG family [Candidatus Woesearchaeota archaeon]|nr:ribbon-helix-helix protein, CopG family [Candidatus Woesearchaeota archaeon]
MKHKLSISVDEKLLERMEKHLANPEFRNKSHFFERAVLEHLQEVKGNGNR